MLGEVKARVGLAVLALLMFSVLIAGCGSSGGARVTQPSQAASRGSKSESPGAPATAVASAFTTFFSGKSGASTKIGLLENGSQFAVAVKAQVASSLARSSSVTVEKVTLGSADRATVVYTVLLAGQAALKDQTGTAVRVSGVWKVSASTFCALLTLEGQAPAACPAPSPSSSSG